MEHWGHWGLGVLGSWGQVSTFNNKGLTWLRRRGGLLWHGQTIAHGAGRERQTRYQQYVEEAIREGIQTSPWEHVQAQLVLGGCEFLEKIRREVGWHREQPQRRALKRRRSWKEVLTGVEGLYGKIGVGSIHYTFNSPIPIPDWKSSPTPPATC